MPGCHCTPAPRSAVAGAADTLQPTNMPRIYFPKIPLVLQSPASLAEMQGANQLVFRTTPAVGKVRALAFRA